MVSNLTNLTTATNFYDIIKFNSDVTGGIIGVLFIFTVFFILLIMFLRNNSFEDALLGSSFLAFAISIFLRTINLITFTFVIIFGVIMAFAGFWVYLSKK